MDLLGVATHEPATVADAPRQAAVVAPVLTRNGEPHVLFIKRAEDLVEHPGQMSFPGGGREPEDADLTATAIREANEEVGLRAEEADLVGRLDDIRTVSGYSIRPFVATVPDRRYVPDDYEVAEIVALAVADLIDPANYATERREHPETGSLRLHYFAADGYTVWGATGQMLAQLIELATDWRVPPPADAAAPEALDADPDRP